jgi:NADH:ubiquinone oxidoreductase subunit 2 (subunit N)
VEINYTALLPEIILSLMGILIMLLTPFIPRAHQNRLGYLAQVGMVLAFICVVMEWGQRDLALFEMIFQDSFGQFSKMFFLFVSSTILLISINYLEQEKLFHGEFFALLLFATVGMFLMASQEYPLILLLGLGLIVVGFGFKVALAPFHVWTPDVYEGAPIPITAHLAVGAKAAAFLALVRVLYQVLPDLSQHWQAVLWVSAILTMAIGNIAALTQGNIKRMLAYSSIAHAGYLLVGLTAHSPQGTQGILFYLMAYALMTLGAFTVVQIVGRQEEQNLSIEDYSGLGYRNPFLSISLSVFLISLAGIPATAGFMGKLFLLAAAVENQMYWLVVIAVLASAIGIYYYLRVIVYMYMGKLKKEEIPITIPTPMRILIAIMVLGTLYLGVLPGALLSLAREAVSF